MMQFKDMSLRAGSPIQGVRHCAASAQRTVSLLALASSGPHLCCTMCCLKAPAGLRNSCVMWDIMASTALSIQPCERHCIIAVWSYPQWLAQHGLHPRHLRLHSLDPQLLLSPIEDPAAVSCLHRQAAPPAASRAQYLTTLGSQWMIKSARLNLIFRVSMRDRLPLGRVLKLGRGCLLWTALARSAKVVS